jgi:hypothetical protein
MNVRVMRSVLVVMVMLAASSVSADPSKEECVDAHARGQDARDQNKLSLARKLFLTCAQAACPALVQGDCAKFTDDLGRQQPTVTFAARDGNGADLPDTTVYVDGVLVATRLDDGRAYDVDPGPHTVKFLHNDATKTTTVVFNVGEKGRNVPVNFGGGESSPNNTNNTTRTDTRGEPPKSREPQVTHPTGAKVLIIAGATLLAGGAAWGIYKFTSVPDECSFFDNTCLGTPGNPRYDDASSAAKGVNIGMIVGGVGAAALIGGIVWYAKGAKTEEDPSSSPMTVAPWLDASGAGIALSGHL